MTTRSLVPFPSFPCSLVVVKTRPHRRVMPESQTSQQIVTSTSETTSPSGVYVYYSNTFTAPTDDVYIIYRSFIDHLQIIYRSFPPDDLDPSRLIIFPIDLVCMIFCKLMFSGESRI